MMIITAGVIGAGKTSLTGKLAQFLNTKPFYEPVKNNPILPRFYEGNKLVQQGRLEDQSIHIFTSNLLLKLAI